MAMKNLSKTHLSYTFVSRYVVLDRHPTLPPPIQAHIDHLCEQIDDLALQLAEERLNHKQTKLRVRIFLVDILLEITVQLGVD